MPAGRLVPAAVAPGWSPRLVARRLVGRQDQGARSLPAIKPGPSGRAEAPRRHFRSAAAIFRPAGGPRESLGAIVDRCERSADATECETLRAVTDTEPILVEPMSPDDADDVLAIYGEGMATGDATFDTEVPDWRRWNATHRRECRLVARLDGRVVGWTALSSWSGRPVYAGVVWESVYVAASARGRGVGRALLEALIPASEDAGIWTLIAGIQAENVASLRLHESVGFRRVGVHEGLGRDARGRWRDVVILERRSAVVRR